MQKIKIAIEDCGEFARCRVPLYGDLYGKTVEELIQILDMMSKANVLCYFIELEI